MRTNNIKAKWRLSSILFALAYTIFLACHANYFQKISDDTLKIGIYYIIIVLLISTLNLIHSRRVKWLIVLFAFVLPISILVFTDNPNNDFTLIYVIQISAPANIWQYLNHANYSIWLLFSYFILPIIYWYGLYKLAKWITNNFYCKTKKQFFKT
jgi:hypothetical protein